MKNLLAAILVCVVGCSTDAGTLYNRFTTNSDSTPIDGGTLYDVTAANLLTGASMTNATDYNSFTVTGGNIGLVLNATGTPGSDTIYFDYNATTQFKIEDIVDGLFFFAGNNTAMVITSAGVVNVGSQLNVQNNPVLTNGNTNVALTVTAFTNQALMLDSNISVIGSSWSNASPQQAFVTYVLSTTSPNGTYAWTVLVSNSPTDIITNQWSGTSNNVATGYAFMQASSTWILIATNSAITHFAAQYH